MNEKYSEYRSPLCGRYASKEMCALFSEQRRFTTWRRLWVALARAENKLGLPITEAQIAELAAHIDDVDIEAAAAEEKITRHDVMAHVRVYGRQCPGAAGIIHLGATSCYVGDNTDILLMREGLVLIRTKLCAVLGKLGDFALEHRTQPALAYTHLQPAQPTTVGKRAAMWAYELLLDLEELNHRIDSLALLGSKGTTGTQASFMELFEGDEEKVKELDRLVAVEMGFSKVVPVSGQTYSRKVDAAVLATLSGIAQSASKFGNDMRLLQSFKEMEEPFEKNQIGSSAMAYKRNPMRCERICSLARYVIANSENPALSASTQWLERTLDDSANRRIAIPEAFLAIDAILALYLNVVSGLVVYPAMIERRLMAELPFMATENILMDCVKRGGNRQELHERIRVHSQAAGAAVKFDGKENDLMERIVSDPVFNLTKEEAGKLLSPALYIGRAPGQVVEFVEEILRPAVAPWLSGDVSCEINV
ncbi:Adenylosuccinate lyase [bioreactor metagenome]|uniref:Adenylosuccinate lyase n=1 Tax=bioreactor metagenome TaxID=1076179 RepID=A0A644XJM9_9ZZZZ